MVRGDAEECRPCHKVKEPWTTMDVHVFIITIDYNVNVWPSGVFNESSDLLLFVDGVGVDLTTTLG